MYTIHVFDHVHICHPMSLVVASLVNSISLFLFLFLFCIEKKAIEFDFYVIHEGKVTWFLPLFSARLLRK